jgi:hypothetical protein
MSGSVKGQENFTPALVQAVRNFLHRCQPAKRSDITRVIHCACRGKSKISLI